MRSGHIYPRYELRESDERPGEAWELVCAIKVGEATGKLWKRISIPISLSCAVCGNKYMWAMDADKCPHCHPEVEFGIR